MLCMTIQILKGVIIMRSFFMRYPGGKAKALTFSYDDGVPQIKSLQNYLINMD